MIPTYSCCNSPGVNVADIKATSDFCIAHAGICKTANFSDCISREFRHSVLFSILRRIYTMPFVVHVVHIIRVCTKKQVGWITTNRIIAMVTNKQAFWNRAISQLISNMTCTHRFVFTCACNTISRIVDIFKPRPTLAFCLNVNALPKTFCGCDSWLMMTITELSRLAFDVVEFFVISFGDRRFVAASSMTVTKRYFIFHSSPPNHHYTTMSGKLQARGAI